jgi:serine/threonine-protein kinase
VGRYVLLAAIGAGGMGEVWKARDTTLDRMVAVKRLKGRRSSRFEQEARAIAALNHPHICQIYDIGPDYLVLEYIEGQPLKGPTAAEEAVRLAVQIVEALDAAHHKGVIHRDLKPANIMVTSEGSVKLVDFGLATQVADADETATLEGNVVGTAAYMAPEQIQGKKLDGRSDMFSLGAVLYELLSGRRAFPGETTASAIAAVLHSEPEPLDSPPGLSRIVKRCLAKQPSERYQTMTELRSALESVSRKSEDLPPSIVVLPFANLSRDADDEYFSDGLAGEIINALTQISGLKVIARTSAFAFKGKSEDIRKIAGALGVTNVLEGSVRRVGNRLRVTAELIHAADGTHLWAQRYDREMTDVFVVQDDIAAAITEVLKLKLSARQVAARPHEPNLPAYEAFLKGVHQFPPGDRISAAEASRRAEDYFKQAIALDSQWAAPYAALSRQHFYLGLLGSRSLSEMVPLARAEARKSLELSPSEPDARAVLGAIAASHDYDWKEAEKQFSLALEAESVTPIVRDVYATFYLLPFGRFEEAIEHENQAIAQDPLNPFWRARRCIPILNAEMYERAIVEGHKALEFNKSDFLPYSVIAAGHFFAGNVAEAREPAEEAVRRSPWSAWAVGFLAGLLAFTGEKERAERLIESMQGTTPIGMIVYHLVCRDLDAATDWYERAIEQRQPMAVVLAAAGYMKAVRSSPRWSKLAKMMNLPATN